MIVTADAIPDQEGVFRGLAQAPLHLHNAVAELIDNAIAVKGQGFNIHIDISEKAGKYDITVVDDCEGISLEKLKSHVFKVGKLPPPGSPHLCEHGFGLKNVLAKAQDVGGSWEIWTRDKKAIKKKACFLIKSPLQYQLPIEILRATSWPEYGSKSSGTVVRLLAIPLPYLQSVTRGRRGAPPSSIGGLMEILREHLGVFYRGYLEGRRPIGNLTTSINWNEPEEVEPVKPDYKTHTKVTIVARTRKGRVRIEGEYGEVEPNSPETRSRLYYYRNSAESQGVDFRVGNRIIATRLIAEIWERARHPTYNPFCGEFRISPDIVPRTLNNKTSINFDDEVWQDIAAAIRRRVELPKWRGARTESELREELASQLEAHKRPGDIIQQNYDCFAGAGVVVDIVRDETHRGGEFILYETKAGTARPLDVYQLRMYWDGVVEDGKRPTAGILVAEDWTSGTDAVVRYVNTLKDKNGKKYQFELRKWSDFGMSIK